ncbi:MAG: hypothetical protein Q8M34_05805 [Thermodesulfovibrionales bacterium]|nr:hypothetical protein [Thermodesulfovibrionales bacterium]
MSVDTLKIYEILSANLPEAQAKTVAKAIDEAIEADTERKKEILATKEDISRLEKEIARLEIKIESTKAEIIKWMFIFWLSQIGVTTGIIFAMLKLYFR